MDENLFLQPKEVNQALIAIGEKKAASSLSALFVYGILAGIYIGFGAAAATAVLSGGTLDPGFGKFLAGTVFSVGLMLVLIPGAELFTGNILMVIGLLSKKYGILKMLRNWLVVYLGNFIGGLLLACLVFNSGLLQTSDLTSTAGNIAVKIAESKISLTFFQGFCRGILCNMLVCLAIIMCLTSKTVTGKIFGIYFPIMLFVASGYEHSIANMYFIPSGLMASGQFFSRFWEIFRNLIPVTIGNIVGGLMIVLLHPKSGRGLARIFKA
ncbi:MAG: formate/nitrite transporter family protein [Candidatus Omnitrophica bacterium]|nr:formate/nitrite transporter family protein [Candidatus Omnitrophota bacterium]